MPMLSDPPESAPGTPVPPSALDKYAPESVELRRRVVAAIGDFYELGEEIGRGGMAVVYAARDTRLRRQVALKVLPPELAFRGDVRARFVREAQTAARLNHPNIVPIYAVDERDGIVYFAMALVEGESLAELIKREPKPPIAFVGQVLDQVADALAYAHSCGVVHRDIKPDNILLDRESGRAVVTDFGIARAAESGARLTQTGIAVGTPAFMSPEQATGEREVDGRSDIYGLGVVGYLMLAGRLPFEATSTPAMLIKHVTEIPIPIESVRPDAPRPLVQVLERCLEKRPADRYADAKELRDAVRRAMQDIASGKQSMADPFRVPGTSPATRTRNAPSERVPEQLHRPGTRAEQWSPRDPNLPNALPAGRLPEMPPLHPNATSGEFRDWRRAVRAQRREAKERWRIERKEQRKEMENWSAGSASEPLDVQVHRFQGKVIRSVVLMAGLGAINATVSPGFPWAVFPAFGITTGLVNDYVRMRDRGVRWRDIFGATRAPDALAAGRTEHVTADRIEREILKLRQRLRWLAGFAVAGVASFAIGGALNLDPMIVPFVGSVIGSIVAAQLSMVSASRLRGMGVSVRRALGSGWRNLLSVVDERPREIRVAEEIARIAGGNVMQGKYAQVVRDAVDDRVTIRDASSRLSDADKAIVPDVDPTADALLERIGAAATALERLEHDLPGGALQELEARIAKVEAEAESAPDHERRLTLLQRQRASLEELDQRKSTLRRQIDNASMALRSLRLDMVKLRTLGVGAAINDVTSATQEARALSVEIGRALEVADEVRRI